MKHEIKELSLVEKEITIHISTLETDAAIETVIGQKRGTLDEQGFHQEKIPNNLIFEKLKDEILLLAAEQIFDTGVREALEHYEIKPLNQMQFQADFSLERGKNLSFSFVTETIPNLEIPETDGIEIEIQEAVVTEEDIDQIIESLREQMCTLEEIQEDRLAKDGDLALFDFESRGKFLDMMGMSGTNHMLEIGSNQMIADFEKIIKTLKPGESKTEIVTYPAEFPNAALVGAEVETKITLNALKQKILPKIDEHLARKVAQVGSVIELRMILLQQHRRRLTHHFEQDAHARLLERLIQKTEVPLAPALVAEHLEEMIGEYATTMQQRGLTLAEIATQTEKKKKEFLPAAETAARRQLFLLAFARKKQLKPEPLEIEREIIRQAESAKSDLNQFRNEAVQSGLILTIQNALIMRKAMDLLFDKAKKKFFN